MERDADCSPIATEYLHDKKLAAEAEAYAACHSQLKEQYFGQFVAMHRGEVVDVDPDFEPLFLRIQQNFAGITVLVRRVMEDVVPEFSAPAPRLVKRGSHDSL